MRVATLLTAVLLLSSCGGKTEMGANQNTTASQSPPGAAGAEKATETTTANANAPPIDFTFLGITSDKQNIAYRVKVNTTKPIEEVHLALKETDAAGKVLLGTTLVWQNIVKSTRQPIESGKTYDVQDYLYPGTTKAECKLQEVVFKDGTRWSPR